MTLHYNVLVGWSVEQQSVTARGHYLFVLSVLFESQAQCYSMLVALELTKILSSRVEIISYEEFIIIICDPPWENIP